MGFEIVRLDHVQLAMPPGARRRPRRSTQACSGSSRLPKPEPLAARGGCWFVRGPVALHLGVEEDFRPARKAHPALVVRDLAALEAVLAAGRGARCGRTPTVSRAGEPTSTTPSATASSSIATDSRAASGAEWPEAEGVAPLRQRSRAVGPGHGGEAQRHAGPAPGSFSARMVPPSALTTWATMARPRPDPGRPRAAGER